MGTASKSWRESPEIILKDDWYRPFIFHCGLVEYWPKSLYELHEQFPLSLPTTSRFLNFCICIWFGFYSPPTNIPLQSQVTNRLAGFGVEMTCLVHCVLSPCSCNVVWMINLWQLPLFLRWAPYENSSWSLTTTTKKTILLQFLNIMKKCVLSCFRSQTRRE